MKEIRTLNHNFTLNHPYQHFHFLSSDMFNIEINILTIFVIRLPFILNN